MSRAPGGVVIREYVYLDQQVAGQWKIIGGVSVKSDGTYRRMIYGGATGSLFRATRRGAERRRGVRAGRGRPDPSALASPPRRSA